MALAEALRTWIPSSVISRMLWVYRKFGYAVNL